MASIASSSYFPQTSTALGNSNNNSSSVLLGEELHDSSNSQQNTTNSTNPQQQTTTGAGGAASSFLRHRRKSNSSSHNSNNSSFNNNTNYNWANAAGICGCCCDSSEVLEYNYSNATTTPAAALLSQQTNKNPQRMQALPRIRERGEFYIDSFNDQPMSWSFGTNEHNGTWCNSSDQAGTIMSAMVWFFMLYSAFTVTALTATDGISNWAGGIYSVLVFMSLASHAKTSFTDPGSVPIQAIPVERQRLLRDSHSMCGQCQTFKPPGSHHCRICNRCISRMDHHCPWMNNCVGAGNLKHFILFLIYTWSCAAYALILFGYNYFLCADEYCTFHPVVLHLVRVMTVLAMCAFLFTSSMLMNVCYGIMTGIGTIDRLKKKATNTMSQSDEEPIELKDVFGVGGFWTWPIPVDPLFDEYDRVMGYTMPQRLDRERQLIEATAALAATAATTSSSLHDRQRSGSVELGLPKCVNDLLPV